MSGFHNCRACWTEVRCAELGRCLDVSSAYPLSQIARPVSSLAVATGSLSASEAVALADEWLARSIKCNQRCIEACREGAEDFAAANSVRSATYLLCADELRQRMGLPISRQPTENAGDVPRPSKT